MFSFYVTFQIVIMQMTIAFSTFCEKTKTKEQRLVSNNISESNNFHYCMQCMETQLKVIIKSILNVLYNNLTLYCIIMFNYLRNRIICTTNIFV